MRAADGACGCLFETMGLVGLWSLGFLKEASGCVDSANGHLLEAVGLAGAGT